MYYSVKYIQMYSVEQKNGVRGCYHAGSCWHTVFLHSTVLYPVVQNSLVRGSRHSLRNVPYKPQTATAELQNAG